MPFWQPEPPVIDEVEAFFLLQRERRCGDRDTDPQGTVPANEPEGF
jgi:hypothetical protein